MKVFGSRFLESMSDEKIIDVSEWSWIPINNNVKKISETAARTKTHASTYAAEKDCESDTDTPQRGMLIA
ncbi:MAG: hypothetical protein KAU90_08450 [Sulfurovaceae bacterium]|nr:hypothetical protein [Sulfurovaceae bacterium]